MYFSSAKSILNKKCNLSSELRQLFQSLIG